MRDSGERSHPPMRATRESGKAWGRDSATRMRSVKSDGTLSGGEAKVSGESEPGETRLPAERRDAFVSGKSIAVGIVGAGGMGARHARNIHEMVPDARVAAIADSDKARAVAVAGEFGGGVGVFTDAESLARDESVEAVVVASPDSTHAPLALECIRLGKPVLCEKPLATTSEEAVEVVRAEAAIGRRLVRVGFMRRDDPRHMRVKGIVDSGEVGSPMLFKGVHRNVAPGPGTTTESVISNSAVHDFDSARWMLGAEITAVHALGAATDPANGVLDLQTFHLTLSGGSIATIEVFVAAKYGYEVSAEVVGEHGTVETTPHDAPVVRRGESIGQKTDPDWLVRFEEAYIMEARRWIHDLRAGRGDGPDAWDGYVSLLVADAAARSLQSRQPERVEPVERPAIYEKKDAKETGKVAGGPW